MTCNDPAVGTLTAERHAVGTGTIKRDFAGLRVGENAQIGPLSSASEIALRYARAQTPVGGQLVIADALLHGTIEIVVPRHAQPSRRRDHRFDQLVLRPDTADS